LHESTTKAQRHKSSKEHKNKTKALKSTKARKAKKLQLERKFPEKGAKTIMYNNTKKNIKNKNQQINK